MSLSSPDAGRIDGMEERAPFPITPPPFPKKGYGFVIAIIVGVIGLGVCGTGGIAYAHIGVFSNLDQVYAIAMLAGGGGTSFIMGMVVTGGLLCCRQRDPVRTPETLDDPSTPADFTRVITQEHPDGLEIAQVIHAGNILRPGAVIKDTITTSFGGLSVKCKAPL